MKFLKSKNKFQSTNRKLNDQNYQKRQTSLHKQIRNMSYNENKEGGSLKSNPITKCKLGLMEALTTLEEGINCFYRSKLMGMYKHQAKYLLKTGKVTK